MPITNPALHRRPSPAGVVTKCQIRGGIRRDRPHPVHVRCVAALHRFGRQVAHIDVRNLTAAAALANVTARNSHLLSVANGVVLVSSVHAVVAPIVGEVQSPAVPVWYKNHVFFRTASGYSYAWSGNAGPAP